MSKHIETGKEGERLAVIYLKEKGMSIVETNWRFRHWEVDIIATQNNYIHFIEVKTRTSMYFGYPEESISEKKLKNLMNAAEEYLDQNPFWKRVQFDVLAINLGEEKNSIFLIEDVYNF